MAVFILDGGLFVGRFERQKHKKGKSYWWWKRHHNQGLISTVDYKKEINKIMQRDINHFKVKMEMVDDIDKVIVCYDGIYGRRERGKYFKHYKSHKSGVKATKHKGHDIRNWIEECGFNPMQIEEDWEGIYDELKEGDDLIAEQIMEQIELGNSVVILSEDMDMYQFLSWDGDISVHNLRKHITYDSFLEDWDIKPHQLVEWKCLVGDVSDNIKGVKGWGVKKATKFLSKYDTINDFPENSLSEEDLNNIAVWKKIIQLPFNP